MMPSLTKRLVTALDRFLCWVFRSSFSGCPICGYSYGFSSTWHGTLWESWFLGRMVCKDCVPEAERRNLASQAERNRLKEEWYRKAYLERFGVDR